MRGDEAEVSGGGWRRLQLTVGGVGQAAQLELLLLVARGEGSVLVGHPPTSFKASGSSEAPMGRDKEV